MLIMAKKNKKQTSLGWFFWLAFILLVALLFFINKDNIKSVLENTNAKEIFSTKEDKKAEQKEVDISIIQSEIEKINSDSSQETTNSNKESKTENKKAISKKDKKQEEKSAKTEKNEDNAKKAKKDSKKNTSKKADNKKDSKKKTKEKKTTQETKKQKNIAKKNATAPKKTAVKKEMQAKLYFIKIGSDGQIIRKVISRKVPKTDSPMSKVLTTLLRGPSLDETKKGFRSFIPPNTRLLSATVKDGIAILNLSEEFQFNQYGIEAYQEQLAQIVFTVCEFPTVNSVQFLIEGERKNYLGGEGVWIGAPLTPASF